MSQYIPAEDPDNLAFLPADHPLMIRVQNALKKTLEDEHERVHLQLKEREAKVKHFDRERENTAVRLYEVQQNLAATNSSEFQSYSKTETQDELSKLNRTLKQIEDYNVDMKSEIAVIRGQTYQAEKTIMNQEKTKKKQDYLIDSLTDQKKKLNEQIVIIEAQLLAQKDETKAAQDILREAYVEMENIIASKKNLLDRWQKSLLEMQRRDKALQVAREALKVQYEINVQITAELAGVNNEIRKEAEMSETLAASLNRLKMEEKHLDSEKQKLDHDQHKLNAQIKILQQSLQSTEGTAQTVERDNRKLEDEMNIIEDNIMKIHTQAKKVFEQMITKISEHKTLEKKSANLLKQAQVIRQEMEEKEIDKENKENEIARVNIDTLNTTNQLEVLKTKKREVSEERKKKEETVATYELEIRQGHDINEKKQKEVGKLNKLHDEIMNNTSESNRGPLDAQRNHLFNQIKEMTEQAQLLERDWIKKQTVLVKQQQQLSKIGDETSELRTKKTVLEQKKMRLNTHYETHEKEIRNIKIGLKNLQTEMNKLNDGLSKNSDSETKLKNENFHIQSEFVEKLKELERSNVNLELEIDRIKEEKAELLQSIVEAERQLLLWERKIQLEKEIQDALDPNIGQSEITELKKDIHRMELRLDELRKRQESTIQEMERAVSKRETIQLKYTKSDDPASKKAAKDAAPKIAKDIQTLRNSLAQATKNNKEYERKINELQAQINYQNEMMARTQNAAEEIESELSEHIDDLAQKKIERLAGVFEIVKLQSKYKVYDSIFLNRFKPEVPETALRQRCERQEEVNKDMIQVLKEVAESNPQFSSIIRRLTNM